jgi:hypothetical protein
MCFFQKPKQLKKQAPVLSPAQVRQLIYNLAIFQQQLINNGDLDEDAINFITWLEFEIINSRQDQQQESPETGLQI